MAPKIVRFIVTLLFIVSIFGNAGVAYADHNSPSTLGTQSIEPLRAPESKPFDIPALTIPATSALGVQFVHVATAANIDTKNTLIDHPLTNNNPGAIIFVTPDWNPGGGSGTYHSHHIGVAYDNNFKQWEIYNEDGAAMSVGDAFNVIIPPAGTGLFVQTVSSAANSTTIDNPLANNNPNAIILVTPIYNPGGGVSGTNANFPLSVLYNTILNKWTIFDQSGATMPLGTSFNVFVTAAGAGAFVHTATVNGTGSIYTLIDNALTNNHPNAIVFVTPNLNPGGLLDEHPIGVFYGNGYWKIFNRDGSNMPINTAFNVLVLTPRSDAFVHTANVSNTTGNYTRMDNALTNVPGNTNAIVFAMPNFNPGDVTGVFNNHNISMAYSFSGWSISNQDIAPLLPNAAFNVVVPNPDASVFVQKATSANTSLNGTTIDYPLTNGNPNAVILVTPNYDPGDVGGTLDNHPIGVYYVGGKWEILNQDTMSMPLGAAFNVFVPTAGPSVFVHTATSLNSGSNLTVIDNPLMNGNPNALILATPNYNPGGIGGGVAVNFPIGVGYESGINKWAIFNQNGGAGTMPIGAAFNIFVFNPPTVNSSVRASINPTNAASVDFTVTFSESVTGVDKTDFGLTTTGGVSGATVSGVSGSGSVYTVTVNTGAGNGTIRLNVADDDTIIDADFNPLGGVGAGNGNFTNGEIYTIIKSATFADVPLSYWANSYIERLYNAGITGGCSTVPLNYCPDSTVTRAQMAVFLLKSMHGSGFTPPAVGASSGFSDVAINYWAAAWIKQLAAEGITGGCGAGIYCPDATVTRAQMAVFLLKAKHGSAYNPPAASGVFSDVPITYWASAWIEQLAVEGVTSGCGAGIYCPDADVTRAQMAVFLVKAFNLP